MIRLPTGCLEQTMSKLTPTVLAHRYLDLSNQWFDLPPGSRDDTLSKIEHGTNIFSLSKVKSEKQGMDA